MSTNEQTNFDYNIQQINKPIDLVIKRQDVVMNSDNFNSSLKSIEKNLDILYEKTRYLEDSIDYTRVFLNQKIAIFEQRMDAILNNIKDIGAIDRNMSYLEYPVTFQQNVVDSTDRDKDYRVEPCLLHDSSKVLTLSAHEAYVQKMSSINRTSEYMPYDSNLEDLILGEKYRAIYIEDKVQRDGVVENYTCYFPHSVEVNSIDIKPVNCEVLNTTLVYPSGITELLDNPITGMNTNSRMITHFTFSVKCTSYEIIEYILDKELANANNVWDDIKQFEHSLSIDSSTKVEVEALLQRTVRGKKGKDITDIYRESDGETIKVVKYVYVLGLDRVVPSLIKLNTNCYFLSESIDTGAFGANDYLQINTVDNIGEFSNIEYFIVDGNKEVPILPVNEKYVYNERIFPEESLRFAYSDYRDDKKIKKNGMAIDTAFENIANEYDAIYSVSYQPVNTAYSYTPINKSIKIKAIVRIYGDVIDTIPYIQSISVRKFGGNTLWTQVY